jgi:hypothetical protein
MANQVKNQFNSDASKMSADEITFMKKLQEQLKEE